LVGDGRQEWGAAANNRVDDCTTMAGANKNGQEQQSRQGTTTTQKPTIDLKRK
jgi:hypothetical protein